MKESNAEFTIGEILPVRITGKATRRGSVSVRWRRIEVGRCIFISGGTIYLLMILANNLEPIIKEAPLEMYDVSELWQKFGLDMDFLLLKNKPFPFEGRKFQPVIDLGDWIVGFPESPFSEQLPTVLVLVNRLMNRMWLTRKKNSDSYKIQKVETGDAFFSRNIWERGL